MNLKFIQSAVVRTFLTCLLLCNLSGVRAEIPNSDVFVDANYPQFNLGDVDPSIVLRQRGAQIEFSGITPNAEVLYLNLFEDVYLTAWLDHVETDSSGQWAWIGTIEGFEESYVSFVVTNQRVAGTINLTDICYHIRHLSSDLHVIREINAPTLEDIVEEAQVLQSNQNPVEAMDDNNGEDQTNTQIEAIASDILQPAELEVFNIVNQERAINNLNMLSIDASLTAAARAHSQDMSQQNYFSHTSLDGRGPGQRITDAGYSWNTYGENIAAGFSTPEAVMNAWMNSSGHRANILGANFCDLGVGHEAAGNYWTQDFGRKQGTGSCPNPDPVPDPDPTPDPDPIPDPEPTPEPTPDPDQPVQLELDIKNSFSLGQNETIEYVVSVPENATNLRVSIDGSGDIDLYVKRALIAWPEDAGRHNRSEFKSLWVSGSDESVVFESPASGTWHVLLHGYRPGAGDIVVTWETDGSDPTLPDESEVLENGVPRDISLGHNETIEFVVNVPENISRFTVSVSGSEGDADLYVKRTPVQWPQDYGRHDEPEFKSPWRWGSNESVRFTSPAAGVWHVLVHGYRAANATLTATW